MLSSGQDWGIFLNHVCLFNVLVVFQDLRKNGEEPWQCYCVDCGLAWVCPS